MSWKTFSYGCTWIHKLGNFYDHLYTLHKERQMCHIFHSIKYFSELVYFWKSISVIKHTLLSWFQIDYLHRFHRYWPDYRIWNTVLSRDVEREAVLMGFFYLRRYKNNSFFNCCRLILLQASSTRSQSVTANRSESDASNSNLGVLSEQSDLTAL